MSQTKVKSGLLNFPDQTDFVKLPSGTTAQRPVSPEKGYSRYNTTDNKLEFWNGTEWQQLPSVTPPTIETVSYPGDDLAADPIGGQTITLTGTNFLAGASVEIGGTLASVVTVVSKTEITFTSPAKAAGDYDIFLTNGDNTTATFVNGISYNGVPSWTTPAGNLGSFPAGSTIPTITLVATEPDSGVISYSVTTGALPTGLTLTGADIDGNVPSPAGETTYNFSVTASDDENQESTERAFNIVVYLQVTNTVNLSDPFGDSSGMAFYKLNNNYTEETGNYSSGVFAGSGTTSFSDGIFNESLYFTGVSTRRMKMPGISSSIMGSSYSFSCWVNYVSIGNNSSYFQTATGSGTYTTGTYNQFNFSFGNGNVSSSAKRGLYTDPNEVIGSGAIESIVGTGWRFITGTLDASTGDITAYLDGREVWKVKGFFIGGLTTSGPNDEEVYIGNHPNSWYNNIKYDQIRWFNRALTPLEVSSLYQERTVVCGGQAETVNILGDNSCIALYPLDGNANDLSGNYSGTPTDVSYGVGEFDLAGVFNGSSSYSELPANIFPSNNFTVSFWFNTNNITTGQIPISGRNTKKIYIQINGTPGNGTIRVIAGNNLTVDSASVVSANTWYHLAVTQSSTSGVTVYLNDSVVASNSSYTGDLVAVTGKNLIGAYYTTAFSNYFDGSIDQVRIFNKALSAGEVTTLYNESACEALACSGTTNTLDILGDSSCVAAYPLDGSPLDLSGNYNGVQTDVTYPQGYFDLAADFNNGYIDLGRDSNGLSGLLNQKVSQSVSFWMNASSPGIAGNSVIYSVYAGGGISLNIYYFPDGTLYFFTRYSNVSTDYQTVQTFNDSQWHHIAVSIDIPNLQRKVYIDNVLVSTQSLSSNNYGAEGTDIGVAIGTNGNFNTQYYNGRLDQLRIFNKPITAGEVTTLYNETACN